MKLIELLITSLIIALSYYIGYCMGIRHYTKAVERWAEKKMKQGDNE